MLAVARLQARERQRVGAVLTERVAPRSQQLLLLQLRQGHMGTPAEGTLETSPESMHAHTHTHAHLKRVSVWSCDM